MDTANESNKTETTKDDWDLQLLFLLLLMMALPWNETVLNGDESQKALEQDSQELKTAEGIGCGEVL